MSIKNWKEEQRPREKLLNYGADKLSDKELLAIFLRTGTRGKSAVDLAEDLINSIGDINLILQADQEKFCSFKGLGPAKYALLQAVLEMAKRNIHSLYKRGKHIKNPSDSSEYLKQCLVGEQQEVFAALLLDNQYRIIKFEILFKGTINSANVYPREVIKIVLKYNAAAVIFAHNHPSGVAEPSNADKLITHKLRDALALVDVKTLDHFVIGDGEPVSLADLGLI